MITQTGSLINLNQDHDATISKCIFIVENVADGLMKDDNGKTIYSKRISFLAKDVIDLKNVRYITLKKINIKEFQFESFF